LHRSRERFSKVFCRICGITLYPPVLTNGWVVIGKDPRLQQVYGPHVMGRILGEESKVYLVPKIPK
jgi:hypothetical protein